MNFDYPGQVQEDQLRSLWKEAFGDTNAFLDSFYTHGFAPDRCRCATVDGQTGAALYWFDCSVDGNPVAYLYGIATAKARRGQGLCRALMENTHAHLRYLGYAGAILVPADRELQKMYEKMGYEACSRVSEISCAAGTSPATMRAIDTEEFCRLRRQYLPCGGVVQEGESIQFLAQMADFYAGEDFLVTVSREDSFFAPELLGNLRAAPEILTALHREKGIFRTPGEDVPFAMYHPLSDAPVPAYFGLAFD